MVLFFILAMVAAYTNRNLIFEQRTSANSYRSARSLAAADAAVDWTIARLNGGVIGTSCGDADADATNDFKTRYLNLTYDGKFEPKLHPLPAVFAGTPLALKPGTGVNKYQIQPSCSGTSGGSWACNCPTTGPPALLHAGNAREPTFTIAFEEASAKEAGVIGMKIRACDSTRSGTITADNVNTFGSCHVNDLQPNDPEHKNDVRVDAMTMLSISLGLISALPVPPSAALTVVGPIDQTAGTLTAINPDPLTGLAVHSGGPISSPATVRAAGPAGSTANVVSTSDADLIATDFFRKALGLPADKYKQQPASVVITCSGICSASTAVIPKLAKGPTRIMVVDGDLDLDAAAIGSDATPAMLVVNGKVVVSGSISLKGVLFVAGDLTWEDTAGTVDGAVIVGGKYSGKGAPTITYNQALVQRIHKSYGSFVRVPGTWNLEIQ
jgi:hypothetical protein